jgi:hypothetical protein
MFEPHKLLKLRLLGNLTFFLWLFLFLVILQVVTIYIVFTRRRLYDLAALRAACSLDSSSCESEVFRILPPVPFNSSSTLSGLAFLTSTNRLELPTLSLADNSFMKRSLIPTSVSAPEAAPAAAFRKIRPVSDPQKPPLSAPSAVRLGA